MTVTKQHFYSYTFQKKHETPLLWKESEKGGGATQDQWAALIWRLLHKQPSAVIRQSVWSVRRWTGLFWSSLVSFAHDLMKVNTEDVHARWLCAVMQHFTNTATSGHPCYKCVHMTKWQFYTWFNGAAIKTDSLGLCSEQNMSSIDSKKHFNNCG